MRDHADDQQLVSEELTLFGIELYFVDFFDGADLASDLVSRVIYVGKFATANSSDLLVDFSGGVEFAVLAQMAHPFVKHLLILVVHASRFKSVTLRVQ